MDYPKKYKQAFASLGDYNVIPDTPSQQGEGFASFSEGFPPELSLPFSQSGKAVKRLDINGILNAITQFQLYQQSGGMFNYDSTVDYDPPALVWAGSTFYKCIKSHGPTTSTVMDPTKDSTSLYWVAMQSSNDLTSLWAAVNNKSSIGHKHTASDITGGIGGTISAYRSGISSFYVKFTNGFIIQGGRLTSLNANNVGQTVSLPTAFATNNFTVAMTSLSSYASKQYNRKATINSKSSVTFYDCMSGAGTWLACGF